jgi:acetyltransferase
MSVVATPSPPPLPPPTAIRTRDGSCLFVRSMRRSDGQTLAAAVAALSPRSRYLRFLTPKPGLTRREVAALTDLDHHAREALVAVDPRTGSWVAVARYAAFRDDPGAADVAVTVADAWQRRCVGTALVALLLRRARQEGLTRLHATTLAENTGALRLLRRQGFVTAGRDGGALELVRHLEAATAPAAPALAVAC